MDNDSVKKENGHDVSIALIQKDVQYIRESLTKIDTTLALMDRNYTRRDDFNALHGTVKTMDTKIDSKADHADFKQLLEVMKTKVDHTDFDPIKKTLTRINWLVIAAVVSAILAFLFKVGSSAPLP